MEWVLIFWLAIDRGGGPATADFSTKERCEAAGKLIFETQRYPQAKWSQNVGNYICAPK